MSASRHPEIRELLREHEDGMTVDQIAQVIGVNDTSILRRALEAMPDSYVDRWEGPNRGQYARVWCVVIPPPDCPHPTKQAA